MTSSTEKYMQNLGIQTEAAKNTSALFFSENAIETECRLLFLEKYIHCNANQRGHYFKYVYTVQ